ncbi:MAG: response regulator [Limisphaerales bacterium]
MAVKTILIVEDNAVIVHVYRMAFLHEGFQIEVAEDGLTAMKKLAIFKPDIVVLDLMMPVFNGVDLLKHIRSSPHLKSIPVIILSEGYMSELAQAAAKFGVEQTLLKSSCTPTLLLKVVRNFLAGTQCDIDPSQRIAIPGKPGKA